MERSLILQCRVEGGCVVLEASGEFTCHHRGRFVNTIRREMQPGVRKVVVDVGGLERMTASALAELAEIHCMLAEAGCQLVMVNLTAQVRKLLLLSFLDKVIATASSVEEALASG
jgi:anti-anti-sigma factor